jgi:MFS family permease
LALVFASYSAGNIVSPIVGGWIASVWGMHTTYIVALFFFVISTLVVMRLPDYPVQNDAQHPPLSLAALQPLMLFSALVFAAYLAMYIGQPLAPNFLRDTGWSVASVGALGSMYAIGITLLGPLLGRLGAGRRRRGILAAQALVWLSLGLLWLGARSMVGLVFVAFFLRGGYIACRTLVSAQIVSVVAPTSQGMALGLLEMMMSAAQMAGAYLAGWLYTVRPDLPIVIGWASVPVAMLAFAVIDALPRNAPSRELSESAYAELEFLEPRH